MSSHGTDSGYTRHRRDNTPACLSCLAAHALAERRRRAQRHDNHGTPEGLAWHRRNRTPLCEPCLDAAVYAELRARRDYYRERLAG